MSNQFLKKKRPSLDENPISKPQPNTPVTKPVSPFSRKPKESIPVDCVAEAPPPMSNLFKEEEKEPLTIDSPPLEIIGIFWLPKGISRYPIFIEGVAVVVCAMAYGWLKATLLNEKTIEIIEFFVSSYGVAILLVILGYTVCRVIQVRSNNIKRASIVCVTANESEVLEHREEALALAQATLVITRRKLDLLSRVLTSFFMVSATFILLTPFL